MMRSNKKACKFIEKKHDTQCGDSLQIASIGKRCTHRQMHISFITVKRILRLQLRRSCGGREMQDRLVPLLDQL